MSAPSRLVTALTAVDWARNIQSFGDLPEAPARVEKCNLLIALWSKQFEACDGKNPALPFVREVQVQGHYAAALIALAMYKPSAGAMRALVESALYYTYFRSHPAELATLTRDPRYFVQKSDIIEYHKQHTDRFIAREQKLGLQSRLDAWYRDVSALVHGQMPGRWVVHQDLAAISHDEATLKKALEMFEESTSLMHGLFLCTVAHDLWSDFDVKVKKELLKGLAADAKAELGLGII
jgi:hypothetical protein